MWMHRDAEATTRLDEEVVWLLFEDLVACQDSGLIGVGVQGLCYTY